MQQKLYYLCYNYIQNYMQYCDKESLFIVSPHGWSIYESNCLTQVPIHLIQVQGSLELQLLFEALHLLVQIIYLS